MTSYWVFVLVFSVGELLIATFGRWLVPAQRVRVRRLVLITSALLPLFGWLLPLSEMVPTPLVLTSQQLPFDVATGSLATSPGAAPAVGSGGAQSLLPGALWFYLQALIAGGCLIALMRFAIAAFRLRRFVRVAEPLDGQRDVFFHRATHEPFATVVSGRALIVLPAWMADDPARASVAIAHERQHIRQRDPQWIVIAGVFSALLWWHPLRPFWRRQLELDQELVCDEQLLDDGLDRARYLQTLLAVAERGISASFSHAALGLLGGRRRKNLTDLERRIRQMLKSKRKSKRTFYLLIGGFIIAAQCLIGASFAKREPEMQKVDLRSLSAQKLARRLLRRGMRAVGASSGRVIISDTRSGRILAATGLDHQRAIAPRRVLWSPVRPWSLAKPVLAAVALENRVTKIDAHHDTSAATRSDSGRRVRDYASLGTLTTRDVVAMSSNVGAVQIARKVGLTLAQRELRRFGLPRLAGFPAKDVADVALGAGLARPIDLVRFYQAVGRKGDRIVSAAKSCTDAPKTRRIMSAATSKQLLGILHRVVTHGTAKRAKSSKVTIAGKTASGTKTAAFIALTPRLTVWVMLGGKKGLIGGRDAAPIARRIVEAAQRYIQPDC
jgi:hypothetical protein